MEEKSRAQELSVREISLIRELAQIRKEHKRELEYEKFDGYELPPRTQFSMLNKPAVSIKYGVMKFNMACIRLFEGIKYVLPILHPNKKRLALIMCPEEDSASVEWARQKDENWVNKDITSLEFVENIFPLQNADIGRTSKNTDNIFPNIHSPAFRRNCHSQVHNSPRIHVGIPLSAISLPDCCTFSSCPGKSGKGIFSDSSRCGIGIEVVPASRSGSSNTVEL